MKLQSSQPQHTESDVLDYISLLRQNLPQRIAMAITTLLNKDSPEYSVVLAAVQIHYGVKYTQPLTLCQILKRYDMDLYLTLWSSIYCDAINNGQLADQIEVWREKSFSDADINFTLFTYCRSILFSERDGNGQIRLSVREFIDELDNRLIAINERRIVAIKEDTQSPFFLFTRTTPGLLEAVFAKLALDEHNYPVAEYFAYKSIDFSRDRVQEEQPSYLGYLLLAQIIWITRLKDNNPRATDVLEFQRNIKIAKEALNPKERSYIEAEILFFAANSNYHSHWISEDNLLSFMACIEKLEREEGLVFKNDKARYDHATCQKIEQHLEDALEGDMYPLAVMLFSREVLFWKSSENQKSYDEYLEKLVVYLEVACFVHGFVPAFYEYAKLGLCNSHAITQWGEREYVLDTAEQYLNTSEVYIYMDPTQRRELSQQIAEYKQTNCRFT